MPPMTTESGTASPASPRVSPGEPLTYLHWHPDFASGNVRIDFQHRGLINAVNDLIDASSSGPHDLVIARLDELISHTLHHFRDEEAILLRNGYPKLTEHARSHAGLIGQMLGFRERVHVDPDAIAGLIAFMVEVVVAHHMMEVDRHFYAELGPGGGPDTAAPAG